METFKVSVDVKVDFSESTKQFISQLVSSISNAAPTASVTSQAPTAIPERGTTPEAAPAPAAPAPAAPAQAPAAPAQAPAAPALEVTIEQVRQALAAKVNGHREEIKAQLSKFGAPSVTRLDPSHYTDMLIFLNSLA